MPRTRVVLVLLLLLGATRAVASTLQPLGDLPGGDFYSSPSGVSADGSVVVGYSNSASGYEAFRWTAGGGIVGLGDLPGGIFQSNAFAVSADGSIAVGESRASALENAAFRWTSAGGMVGLGDLPGGGFASTAYGVSGDGSVIVGQGYSASGYEAFRWTAGGGMVGLGNLPGDFGYSYAFGVSADGSVVVGVGGNDAGYLDAFRWTAGGGMVALTYLYPGMNKCAQAVSADGSVVVGYMDHASGDSGLEAFRWTADGDMVLLGDLPGGYVVSNAFGVSGNGSVIVGKSDSASGYEAFRWTAGSGMQRLWDVLLAQGVNPAAGGWSSLTAANAVSADGNTIVGTGTRNGNQEGFVAFVPNSVAYLPGDFNNDGNVNATDYVLWRKGLGTTYDQNDYGVWRSHFGTSLGVGSGSALPSAEPLSLAVPEPGTGVLLCVAFVGVVSRRRVRRAIVIAA
jgi:probable HAF family extracellular repeat protein